MLVVMLAILFNSVWTSSRYASFGLMNSVSSGGTQHPLLSPPAQVLRQYSAAEGFLLL
jgi:hypothetical protein